MPGNESREVKGEEKCCCWHYPNIPRNSGQSRTILCPDYFTESKIGYGFQQSDFLEVREKPRDGPDSYQEAPYFTWLILFAKEPNQSHLLWQHDHSFLRGPRWNYWYLYSTYHCIRIDYLSLLFILLWTIRRILFISFICLTIAITQWQIHWRYSINDIAKQTDAQMDSRLWGSHLCPKWWHN